MATPETQVLHPERLNEAEFEVYNRLVPKYRQAAISLEKFRGLYKDIDKDLARVAELEKRYIREDDPSSIDRRRRGELLEALLTDQIELENWLGQDARTIVPSRYDDLEHGVDIMVLFEIEGFIKYLALSVDATTSKSNIAKKIKRIRDDIDQGRLTRIKYFLYEPPDQPGQRSDLSDVPRVVVGADVQSTRELARLWLDFENARRQKRASRDPEESDGLKLQIQKAKKKLAEHRTQFQILYEIKAQLEYFIKLALAQNKNSLAVRYQGALDTINDVLNQKDFKLDETERQKIEQDEVYRAIIAETQF